MARTIKSEKLASKRREILDAAQQLVLTKGYEKMSIKDILDELRISSGAFHHYFDSRNALLEALTERMQQEMEYPLLPIVHDPNLPALEKLQRYFATFDRLRISHKAVIVKLLHVWYTDDNAIIRQKVDEAALKQRAPLLTVIVRQGIQEDVFKTAYPDQAGEVILSLLQGMGNTHAKLLLSFEQKHDEWHCVEGIVAVHAAYMDAIERVLGAPTGSLYRTDAETVKVWMTALRGNNHV